MRLPDRHVSEGHPSRHRRSRGPRWTAGLLLILVATSAGCAGMPPSPPPAQLPDDSYSGGSNFGGRPMRFGPQV